MIAAAGAGVPAVDKMLVRAEANLGGVLVKAEGDIDGGAPACRRLDIDLDHAGIGRDLDHLDTRVEWRRIALDVHLHLQFLGGRLYRRDQFQIVLELFHRRHECAENAVADLDRHRGADAATLELLLLYLLMRRGVSWGGPVVNRQCPARLKRILLDDVGIFLRRNMRQRGDRQAQPQRGIAWRQKQVAAPQFPALAAPAPGVGVPALDRQDESLGYVEPLIEYPRHPRALFRIGQFGIARIDIRWQRRFLLQPVARVFERRHDELGIDAELFCGTFRKALGVFNLGLARALDRRDQIGILPDRHAVLAPIEAERPARQAFARIPFALPVM